LCKIKLTRLKLSIKIVLRIIKRGLSTRLIS
jgi:hypothetical protein